MDHRSNPWHDDSRNSGSFNSGFVDFDDSFVDDAGNVEIMFFAIDAAQIGRILIEQIAHTKTLHSILELIMGLSNLELWKCQIHITINSGLNQMCERSATIKMFINRIGQNDGEPKSSGIVKRNANDFKTKESLVL